MRATRVWSASPFVVVAVVLIEQNRDTRRAERENLCDDASRRRARKASSKMAEDIVLPIPNLNLAQQLFVLSKPGLAALQNDARKTLLEGIKADRALNRVIG